MVFEMMPLRAFLSGPNFTAAKYILSVTNLVRGVISIVLLYQHSLNLQRFNACGNFEHCLVLMAAYHLLDATAELNEGYKSAHQGQSMFGGKPDMAYLGRSKRQEKPAQDRRHAMHLSVFVLVIALVCYLILIDD